MASPIIQNILYSLPVLLAALALLGGGVALIASGRRTRSDTLAQRVAMVEPTVPAIELRQRESQAVEEALFRQTTGDGAGASRRETIRLMAHFGVAPRQAPKAFTAARLTIVALLATVIFVWASQFEALTATPLMPLLIAAMAAIVGWFLPTMLISYGIRQRTKAVRSGLPDALELLVVCVEAGLSLEDGFGRVVTELRHSQPALADELNLTLADLRILPSRDQALANLAERVDVPSVRAVVTTLAQTLRYGTPLAQALRVTAAELRNDYLIELEERANRLPAYLTLPVIVFLMPTIFLIVGGPAALRLIDAFAQR